ncbi:MAG: hypothetical protein P1U89_23515 [Verrucomicrobiales bacterium]|nr:hypothetical protein [Verrucomicrobiales bacterium]
MKAIIYLFFALSTVWLHAAEIDYHNDVAPILRDYCGGCHNEADYDGDFSIETFRSLMEGGESEEPIITPGDLSKSFLASTILKRTRPAMPPKKEPQLSQDQIKILTTWIKQGARGPAPEEDHSILATLNVPEIKPSAKNAKPVTAAEYAPDGTTLAVGRYGEVQIGDLKIPVEGKVNQLHFSRDGKKIIIASGITGLKGIATIHDAVSGKERLRIGDGYHRDILYDAEISPDGKLIATTGYDRTIQLWNAGTGDFIRKIEGHNGAIFDIAFSPDSSLIASASADETGKVWRVSDGERLDTLNQPEGEQFRITFTPDGQHIIAAGGDKKIRMWRLVSKTKAKINPVLHARFAHEEAINELTISPDGKWLASASADQSIKLWSLPDLYQVEMIGGQEDFVSALAFNRQNQLIAGRMDGRIVPCTFQNRTLYSPKSGGKKITPQITSSPSPSSPPKNYSESDAEVLPVEWPAEITGVISDETDSDDYLFSAKKGETIVLEINAARSKSLLDSKIEVLTASGDKIERVVLQAVRDSWFTFRGKNSDTSDDFRVHNWEEMELNEYLYANGEVVKLWHYPRGPDSGFKVYPGFGNRTTYFDTTPLSHPLGGPCYIVAAHPAGTEPSPNGLPVYRLFWENDDDGERILGSDSKLTFTAPEDGSYRVRVSDVRGFGGENYTYQLSIRPSRPDFSVRDNGAKLKISPGSGEEIEFTLKPVDGFSQPVQISLRNLPEGLTATPVTIEASQRRAYMAIRSAENFTLPPPEALKKIEAVATAEIGGKPVTKTAKTLGQLSLTKPAKLEVEIHPDGESGSVGKDGILEITVHAGETVSALVKVERNGYDGIVNFGKDDSGRNLPHGVYVDNIGLSGLMIPPGKTEQRFWITAAKWVPGTERLFHLRAREDGGHTTKPVRIKVVN